MPARTKTSGADFYPEQEQNVRKIRGLPATVTPPAYPPAVFDTLRIVRSASGETRSFDGFDSEDISRAAEVTQHTVETGAKPSDHVVAGPRTFSVTVHVNENPHDGQGGQGWSSPSGPARVREALEWLDATESEGHLLSIYMSTGEVLEDYVLSMYQSTRSNAATRAFTLSFTKIEFATAARGTINPVARRGGAAATKPKAGTAADGGGVGLIDGSTSQISILSTGVNNGQTLGGAIRDGIGVLGQAFGRYGVE